MKKIIAASVLCTSLLGMSLPVTYAANECPTLNNVKVVYQNFGMTQTSLPDWVKQYLKNCGLTQGAAKPITWQYTNNCSVQPATPAPQPEQKPAQAGVQKPATDTTATKGLTADEKQMLDLVNQERAKQGIAPLKINADLEKLARMKAQDMIDKNYFSHQSPTYGSPFDMMNKYGVKYNTAGENIAGNSSVQAAHTALMNSAGHRQNILNPNFTEVGIGIVDGGPYGKMFVQMFKG
jgi:uncharacterized YkwD family protein